MYLVIIVKDKIVDVETQLEWKGEESFGRCFEWSFVQTQELVSFVCWMVDCHFSGRSDIARTKLVGPEEGLARSWDCELV